jgi:hypothetical protein
MAHKRHILTSYIKDYLRQRAHNEGYGSVTAYLDALVGDGGKVITGELDAIGSGESTAAALSRLRDAVALYQRHAAAIESHRQDVASAIAGSQDHTLQAVEDAQAALSAALQAWQQDINAPQQGMLQTGTMSASAAASRVQGAAQALQGGLAAFFMPPQRAAAQGMPTMAQPCQCCTGLLLLIDIPSLIDRCILYIYMKANKPLSYNDDDAAPAKPMGGYHYVYATVSEVMERVQLYTAQKARVLARVNAKTDPELQQLGLEGGAEMYAVSQQEGTLMQQFIKEACTLIGATLNITPDMSLRIKHNNLIRTKTLDRIREAMSDAVYYWCLFRWYELLEVEYQIKSMHQKYSDALALLQSMLAPFNEISNKEAMLTNYLHQAASMLWRRMSGYAPKGINYLFKELLNDHNQDSANDYAVVGRDSDIIPDGYENLIEQYLDEVGRLADNLLANKAAFLLNATQQAMQSKALRIAECAGEAMYRYALSAWYGQCDDRDEQALHASYWEDERCKLTMLIGNDF